MKISSLIFTGSLLFALSSCGNHDNSNDDVNGAADTSIRGADNTSNRNDTIPMDNSSGNNNNERSRSNTDSNRDTSTTPGR